MSGIAEERSQADTEPPTRASRLGRTFLTVGAVGTTVGIFAPWTSNRDPFHDNNGLTSPVLGIALGLMAAIFTLSFFAVGRPRWAERLAPLGIVLPLACLFLSGISIAATGIGDAALEEVADWGIWLLAVSLVLGGLGFGLAIFGSARSPIEPDDL